MHTLAITLEKLSSKDVAMHTGRASVYTTHVLSLVDRAAQINEMSKQLDGKSACAQAVPLSFNTVLEWLLLSFVYWSETVTPTCSREF